MKFEFNIKAEMKKAMAKRGLSKEALSEEEFEEIINELLEMRTRQQVARQELEMNFRFINNEA